MNEYKENKFMERVSLIVFVAIIVFVLVSLSGCASSLEAMKDDRFTVGCAVVNAHAKLGMMNQEGNAEACKLVCSENLPSGIMYEYESRGCHVSIGKK